MSLIKPVLALSAEPLRLLRPGHGKANVSAAVSISYNRNVSLQTVRWAMVEWLKDEHRDGIWGVRAFSCVSFRHADALAGCDCISLYDPE